MKKLLKKLKREGILIDNKLEKVFQKIPIDSFIDYDEDFLSDNPTVFYFRTLSAPHMICIMVQELMLTEGMNVLILGAKSGYLEALIAEMVGDSGFVYIVDSNKCICEITEENLNKENYEKRTSVLIRDPLCGYSIKGPWDRILITGQIPSVPSHLKEQLKDGGFILAPIGNEEFQEFVKIIRKDNKFFEEAMGRVVFAPLESELIDILPYYDVKKSGLDWVEQFRKVVSEEMKKQITPLRLGISEIKTTLNMFQDHFISIKESKKCIEEKIEDMYNLIEKLDMNIIEWKQKEIERYRIKLKKLIENWGLLEEESKNFLGVAEYIYRSMKDLKGDLDFSPVSLEYCKVIELETINKIFERYRKKLQVEQGLNLSEYINNDAAFMEKTQKMKSLNIDRYLKGEGKLTLGDVSITLNLLSGKTAEKSYILYNFNCYIQKNFKDPTFILEKEKLPNIIEQVRIKYRNGAAHIEPISKKDIEECREHIIENVNLFLNAL